MEEAKRKMKAEIAIDEVNVSFFYARMNMND